MDQDFIRKMREKVDEEMRRKEREVIDYWRVELEKVIKRKRGDLGALTSELEALLGRMEKRRNAV